MPDSELETNIGQLVNELDAAMQSHLAWTRRILRCAVLRISPGDDVMESNAHTLCHFGRWFSLNRALFDSLDDERAQSLEATHRAMHDSVRAICSSVLSGKPCEVAQLDKFEATQHQTVEILAYFKTLAVTQSAQTDALTGLSLRHQMERDFALITKPNRKASPELLVMMVDADHFKSINDQHGHAAGDLVLQELANTLNKTCREGDMIYRYGGEEFVMLLETSVESQAAQMAAQRILDAVRALSITLPDGAVTHPTVTIGIALHNNGESLSSVIHRADEAMYSGKIAGRNCYMIAP